jgi:hypothetical protein
MKRLLLILAVLLIGSVCTQAQGLELLNTLEGSPAIRGLIGTLDYNSDLDFDNNGKPDIVRLQGNLGRGLKAIIVKDDYTQQWVFDIEQFKQDGLILVGFYNLTGRMSDLKDLLFAVKRNNRLTKPFVLDGSGQVVKVTNNETVLIGVDNIDGGATAEIFIGYPQEKKLEIWHAQ